MNAAEVITSVLSGEFDDSLSGIINACQERKKVTARSLYYVLNIGDRVRIDGTRPQYLNGAVGTVVGKKQTMVVVDLDARRQRFHTGIICPPSILRKIDR
jgi:ribosomal protein L21E